MQADSVNPPFIIVRSLVRVLCHIAWSVNQSIQQIVKYYYTIQIIVNSFRKSIIASVFELFQQSLRGIVWTEVISNIDMGLQTVNSWFFTSHLSNAPRSCSGYSCVWISEIFYSSLRHRYRQWHVRHHARARSLSRAHTFVICTFSMKLDLCHEILLRLFFFTFFPRCWARVDQKWTDLREGKNPITSCRLRCRRRNSGRKWVLYDTLQKW